MAKIKRINRRALSQPLYQDEKSNFTVLGMWFGCKIIAIKFKKLHFRISSQDRIQILSQFWSKLNDRNGI